MLRCLLDYYYVRPVDELIAPSLVDGNGMEQRAPARPAGPQRPRPVTCTGARGGVVLSLLVVVSLSLPFLK